MCDDEYVRAEGILRGADPGRGKAAAAAARERLRLEGVCSQDNASTDTLDHDDDEDDDGSEESPVLSDEERARIIADLKIDQPISSPTLLAAAGLGAYPLTPLQAAVHRGNLRTVLLLLAHGASPTQRDAQRRSLLCIALAARRPAVLSALVGSGCPVDCVDEDETGRTLLHVAAAENDFELAKLLLMLRADVNARDKLSRTPLMLACMNHVPPADGPAGLPPGAEPDGAFNDDGTPRVLQYARGDNGAVIRLLLDKGARPNLRDNDGNAAMHHLTFAARKTLPTLSRDGRQRLYDVKKFLCLRGARVAGMRSKADVRPVEVGTASVAGVVFGLEAGGATDERTALGNVCDWYKKNSAPLKGMVGTYLDHDQSLSSTPSTNNASASDNSNSGSGSGASAQSPIRKRMTAAEEAALKAKVSRGGDKWVSDEAGTKCMHCDVEFGFFTRKHHCRVTGALVCWECSALTLLLVDASGNPVVARVADAVYNLARKSGETAWYGGDGLNILMQPHRNTALLSSVSVGVSSTTTGGAKGGIAPLKLKSDNYNSYNNTSAGGRVVVAAEKTPVTSSNSSASSAAAGGKKKEMTEE